MEDHYSRIYRKTMDNLICFLAHWELTYRCNLRCRHCYVSSDESRQDFPYQKAKSIIDELKNMGCLYLIFSGGEILMRDDFFDIASYARKQGFALRLMTNATLIDEAAADRIASLFPLAVETSIYSADRNLHDEITAVSGSFDKTVNAVEFLKKRDIRVVIKFLIMRDNVKDFSAVKSLAETMGADFLFDFCVVSKDDGSLSTLEYRLNRGQIKDFFLDNNIPLMEREADEDMLLCSAGLNNISITPYLDVYPCIGIKYKTGSLWENRLNDLWLSQKLNFIREIKVSDLSKCQKCDVVRFCNRCTGMALAEDKDMFGPSDFDCLVAGARKEIVTKKGEDRYGR